MKIGNVLTPEESMRIPENTTLRSIDEIMSGQTTPLYNPKTDTYMVGDIEYPTEEEAFEAIDEMEI